jgi:uncharacterized membrane protein (GlpM family)
VLAGYLLVVLLLAAHRGLPSGPWAVHSDGGVWLGIVRARCEGGRFYADVWSNKGPLFHLLIIPSCLAANAGDLTVGREVTLALVPMLALGAGACALAARVLVRGALAGAVLGAAGALLFWTSTVREFFVSELVAAPFALAALALWLANRRQPRGWHSAALAAAVTAATLVNLKFAAYGALYLFLRGLTPRRVLRDALACGSLAAAVLVADLGFDADSWRWFLKTLDTGSYGTPDFAGKVRGAHRVLRTRLPPAPAAPRRVARGGPRPPGRPPAPGAPSPARAAARRAVPGGLARERLGAALGTRLL